MVKAFIFPLFIDSKFTDPDNTGGDLRVSLRYKQIHCCPTKNTETLVICCNRNK